MESLLDQEHELSVTAQNLIEFWAVATRPLASNGLAQCAFWFTVVGLFVFYVSLIGNGIAIGRLVEHGWDYQLAKEHMGKWYKVPTGIGAGVMGLGYWCFAANVVLTTFQSRLVKVPKPQWHLWKFFVTGAAALTVFFLEPGLR